MKTETKNKIAIVAFIAAIIIECIALLLWLVPVAGFTIYPFVSVIASVFCLISCFFAGGKPVLRIIGIVFCILLVISIIADVIFLFWFMTGFVGL